VVVEEAEEEEEEAVVGAGAALSFHNRTVPSWEAVATIRTAVEGSEGMEGRVAW